MSRLDKGDCSGDSVIEDFNSEAVLHEETQDQSNKCKEVGVNFHMDSVSHSITLHRQSNQMVCFPPSSSGSVTDNTMVNAVEKSVVEQSRSNDLNIRTCPHNEKIESEGDTIGSKLRSESS